MRISAQELHQLVHSLTKGEKRNFRLQASLTQGDKKYLRLFDLLDGMLVYEERDFRRRVQRQPWAGQVAVLKHYLQQMLLRSLTHYDRDAEKEVFMMRRQGDKLLARGLTDMGEQLLKKALEIAQQEENRVEEYRILESLKLCLIRSGDREVKQEQLLEMQHTQRRALKAIRSITRLEQIQSMLPRVNADLVAWMGENPGTVTAITQRLEKMKRAGTLSATGHLLRLEILERLAVGKWDFEAALSRIEEALLLLPQLRAEPQTVFRTRLRLLVHAWYLSMRARPDAAPAYRAQVFDLQAPGAEMGLWLRIRCFQIRIQEACVQREEAEIRSLLQEFEAAWPELAQSPRKSLLNQCLFQAASLAWAAGMYREAERCFYWLAHHRLDKLPAGMELPWRLLRLLTRVDQGQYDWVMRELPDWKRLVARRKWNMVSLRMLLRTLEIGLVKGRFPAAEWDRLAQSWAGVWNLHADKCLLAYLNLPAWLESRQKNCRIIDTTAHRLS